jgi:Protein of unknown function (DUF3047)
VASRLGWRATRRRLTAPSAQPSGLQLPASIETWLPHLPDGLVAGYRCVEIAATQPPWIDTGLPLQPGQSVTWFATGRVYLSRPLDVWVEPSFQLWGRVGREGSVFRGTRATHTFTATHAGTLCLASYFPGEWQDPHGSLATPAADYAKVSGGMTICIVAWQPGVDVRTALEQCAPEVQQPDAVRAEVQRLSEPTPSVPGWDYLWYLGPGEIYRPTLTEEGAAAIRCETQGDVGILRRDARMPLEPGTQLAWSWRVDALPSDLREDSLPAHDYVSIAVEFDDGQDLTYYWSSSLPVGTVYRCPLPTWRSKETHVVVRSGPAELGAWLDERRDLYADYQRIIAGPARSVARVWLIANSLFQRGHGQCEYARIALTAPTGASVVVL